MMATDKTLAATAGRLRDADLDSLEGMLAGLQAAIQQRQTDPWAKGRAELQVQRFLGERADAILATGRASAAAEARALQAEARVAVCSALLADWRQRETCPVWAEAYAEGLCHGYGECREALEAALAGAGGRADG